MTLREEKNAARALARDLRAHRPQRNARLEDPT